MPQSQFAQVETNLRRLSRREPELPLLEILTLRLAVILGRDLNAMVERSLKPAGLGEAEFRLLLALHSSDGRGCAGELGAALGQSPANLTRLGDVLVERGLVARATHADDRRKMMLTLRPAGEKLIQRLLPRMSAKVSASFEGFSAAERRRLLADLRRLLAGVEAQGEPGSAATEEHVA